MLLPLAGLLVVEGTSIFLCILTCLLIFMVVHKWTNYDLIKRNEWYCKQPGGIYSISQPHISYAAVLWHN